MVLKKSVLRETLEKWLPKAPLTRIAQSRSRTENPTHRLCYRLTSTQLMGDSFPTLLRESFDE